MGATSEIYDSGLAFAGLTLAGNILPDEDIGEDVSQVPVPGGLPLFIGGLSAMGLIGRSRRQKATSLKRA